MACEIGRLRELGVEILADHLIGRTLSVEELLSRFDAVFIGTGAGNPVMLDVPGEDLKGVYTANEFLIRINLMHANEFPLHPTPVRLGENVAVIGAGNTAMDAARVAVRLGARNVYLVYRRGRKDMPARREEIDNAMEEGVQFLDFTTPVALKGDENGFLKSLVCVKTEYFGEPDPADAQKRRSVREIPGTKFDLQVDTVINALGFVVNPLIPQTTPALKTGRKNVIVADEFGRTSLDRVFAGGDAATGGATVISALGQGKRAAQAIHAMLSSSSQEPKTPAPRNQFFKTRFSCCAQSSKIGQIWLRSWHERLARGKWRSEPAHGRDGHATKICLTCERRRFLASLSTPKPELRTTVHELICAHGVQPSGCTDPEHRLEPELRTTAFRKAPSRRVLPLCLVFPPFSARPL